MSIYKLAQTIELTMDIPESEKKIAANSVLHFEKLVRKLNYFNKHLDIIYNPFKEYQEVSQESVKKYRAALWNYLKQIIENFEQLKDLASICVKDLNYFKSDTHMNELINSFTNEFGDFEDQIVILKSIMSNWELPTYKDSIVKCVENIKKDIIDIKKLIYDRIIDNINTNILAKNWVDKVDTETNSTIKDNEPLISRLYHEREEKLNKG